MRFNHDQHHPLRPQCPGRGGGLPGDPARAGLRDPQPGGDHRPRRPEPDLQQRQVEMARGHILPTVPPGGVTLIDARRGRGARRGGGAWTPASVPVGAYLTQGVAETDRRRFGRRIADAARVARLPAASVVDAAAAMNVPPRATTRLGTHGVLRRASRGRAGRAAHLDPAEPGRHRRVVPGAV